MKITIKPIIRYRFTESDLKAYWNRVAERTKIYHDAYSTQIYFQQEKRFIQEFLTPIEGRRILKTDLWNEVKNTRILNWIAEKKAKVFGLDISDCIAQEAVENFGNHENRLFASIADLRRLPYRSHSFDYIYSMGTLEHFPDYDEAIQEMYRVLRPGGKAIIGVPNKYDPFLRPLTVNLLQKMGLYAFGYEKSFSKDEMTWLLSKTGFKVVAQSSLLFMPGILRIMDLFFYCHFRFLSRLSPVFLAPFVYLYERYPFFRQNGYLLAFMVKKS